MLKSIWRHIRYNIFKAIAREVLLSETGICITEPLRGVLIFNTDTDVILDTGKNIIYFTWAIRPPDSGEIHELIKNRLWKKILEPGTTVRNVDDEFGTYISDENHKRLYNDFIRALADYEEALLSLARQEIEEINNTIISIGRYLGFRVEIHGPIMANYRYLPIQEPTQTNEKFVLHQPRFTE